MTDEEASYVELKLVLSAAVRRLRHERHLTQAQLARLMRSSQSEGDAEAGRQAAGVLEGRETCWSWPCGRAAASQKPSERAGSPHSVVY